MPSCAAIDPLVTPFVDGELARRRARGRRAAHRALCPPCRSRVAAEQAVRASCCATASRRCTSARRRRWLRARCAAMAISARSPASPPIAPGAPLVPAARASAPLAAAAALVAGRRRRVPVSGDRAFVARHGRRAHRRSREVLRDERRARHARVAEAVAGGDGVRLRLARAAAGRRRRRRARAGRLASVPVRRRHASRTSCTGTTASRCRCSCCRAATACDRDGRGARPRGAIWSDGDRTFVLIAREDRGRRRAAGGVRAAPRCSSVPRPAITNRSRESVMRMRWAIATLGVLALAALTVTTQMPWLTEGAEVQMDAGRRRRARRAADRRRVSSRVRPTPSRRNLDFTMKDVDEPRRHALAVQGQGHPARLLGDVVRPLQGRDSALRRIPGAVRRSRACRSSASRSTTPPTSSRRTSRDMKMNYPVLQGLGPRRRAGRLRTDRRHSGQRADFARRQDLRDAHRLDRQGHVRARDQGAALMSVPAARAA